MEQGRGEGQILGIGASSHFSVLPTSDLPFDPCLCFVSQAAPDPLGSTLPISVGPAWMVAPAGQSVLGVARGSQWARTRWDPTLPCQARSSHLPVMSELPHPWGWVLATSAMLSFESWSPG